MIKRKLAIVAVGGNSLVKDEYRKSLQHQYMVVKETSHHIADMIEAGWDMAIGHGNGPQLGFTLRRSEVAYHAEGVPAFPMDICLAQTQAEVGYALQKNLQMSFRNVESKNRSLPFLHKPWLKRMIRHTGFHQPSRLAAS